MKAPWRVLRSNLKKNHKNSYLVKLHAKNWKFVGLFRYWSQILVLFGFLWSANRLSSKILCILSSIPPGTFQGLLEVKFQNDRTPASEVSLKTSLEVLFSKTTSFPNKSRVNGSRSTMFPPFSLLPFNTSLDRSNINNRKFHTIQTTTASSSHRSHLLLARPLLSCSHLPDQFSSGGSSALARSPSPPCVSSPSRWSSSVLRLHLLAPVASTPEEDRDGEFVRCSVGEEVTRPRSH